MDAWSVAQQRSHNLRSYQIQPAEESKVTGPRSSTVDLLDELEWLLEGMEWWEAAKVLGRKPESLSRLAYRNGRPALGKRMNVQWDQRAA